MYNSEIKIFYIIPLHAKIKIYRSLSHQKPVFLHVYSDFKLKIKMF